MTSVLPEYAMFLVILIIWGIKVLQNFVLYSVLHRNLQVRFFLDFCALCKDIKLKIGIDDLQFLHHDITKAKINDSMTQ